MDAWAKRLMVIVSDYGKSRSRKTARRMKDPAKVPAFLGGERCRMMNSMKTIDLKINVPEERVITVKLPEDISTGEHHVVMIIDQGVPEGTPRSLFLTKGTLARGPDISREDIVEAR